MDVVGCLFLFVAWLWLKRFQRLEASHLDRHTVTASDYTVKIKRVPPNVTCVTTEHRHVAVHASLTLWS